MVIHRYWLDGLHVESELPLRSAPAAPDRDPVGGGAAASTPAVRLVLRPIDAPPIDAWDQRETGISIGRAESGYVLRCGDEFAVWVDRSGHDLACQISPDVPHESVEQTFIDQMLPLILELQGRFSFHASAVALGGAVLAFLGETGRGKSTLASSLATSDGVVVCDDCLAVTLDDGQARAYPSYGSTRLWPESANALFSHRGPLPFATPRTDKRRVDLPRSGEPLPLRRLYLLEAGDGPVAIERLGRAAAVGAVLRHLYRLDGLDRERLSRELSFLDALVTVVPVATLAYRRDFAELPAVRAAILADVGATPSSCPPA
jgi:hypothetical protein